MRAITDLIENIVDNVIGSIRRMVILFVGGMVLTAIILTAGAYAFGDEAIESLAAAAEEAEDRRFYEDDYYYYEGEYGSERYSDGATYDADGGEYVGGWGD